MKLALLVLLSICAYGAFSSSPEAHINIPRYFDHYKLTPQNRDKFFDHFLTFISAIIEDTTNFIKEFAEKSGDIILNIQNQVQSIGELATNTVDKIQQDWNSLIQAWAIIAANCTEKYGPLLAAATATGQQEIELCIQNAQVQSIAIEMAIRPNIGQLIQYVNELQTLVERCWSNSTNIFEAIGCVVGQGTDVRAKILQVIMDIKTILLTSTNKGFAMVNEARTCITDAVQKLQTSTTTIQNNLMKCIEAGGISS